MSERSFRNGAFGLVFVVAFLSTSSARADAREVELLAGFTKQDVCTPVDLRNEPRGAFLKYASDQGSSDWCHAYAASTLLTYKLGVPVSAVALALANNRSISQSVSKKIKQFFRGPRRFLEVPFYQSGDIPSVIGSFAESGSCTEEGIPSDLDFTDAARFFSQFAQWRKQEQKADARLSVQGRCGAIEGNLRYGSDLGTSLNTLFPRATLDVLATVLIRNGQKEFNDFLGTLANVACPDKDRIAPQPLKTRGRGHYSNIGQINIQLDRRNPVGIEYDDTKFKPEWLGGGGHASVVIGRQWSAGKCYYLIHNSWGRDCSAYNSKTTVCDYDSGSFWVTEGDLRAALREIVYIP